MSVIVSSMFLRWCSGNFRSQNLAIQLWLVGSDLCKCLCSKIGNETRK